jgi:hypothetical protein
MIQDTFLVTGGLTKNDGPSATIEVLAPQSNTWKVLDVVLPEPLYGHCQVQLNQSTIMIIGGYSLLDGATAKTWYLDVNLNAGILEAMLFAKDNCSGKGLKIWLENLRIFLLTLCTSI